MLGKIINLVRKKDRNLYIKHTIHESVSFGILLAIVGGFLDAYTFIGWGGVFANAQTGNIVLLGVYASLGEWGQALVHIPPILSFIIGVFVAEAIKNNTHFFVFDWKQAVLILEILILFIIGLIPDTVPSIVVTVTISFVASVQVSSFRKLVDSPYNTTMSTGNLRSASQAAYIAFSKKDLNSAIKAIRYIVIILSFLFGAFLGGLLTLIIGDKAIWGATVILAVAVILSGIYKQKNDG